MGTIKRIGDLCLFFLSFIAILVSVRYLYYHFIVRDETVGVNYIDDQLAVDIVKTEVMSEEEKLKYADRYFMKINYYSNDKNNGFELQELNFNYFTDYTLTSDKYRATGIQYVGDYKHTDVVVSSDSELNNYVFTAFTYYDTWDGISYDGYYGNYASTNCLLKRATSFTIKIDNRAFEIQLDKFWSKKKGWWLFSYDEIHYYTWSELFESAMKSVASSSFGYGDYYLFVGALIFVITWGVINFNKVKDGMSNTGIYTKEDLEKSYEDGYNTALTDKEEYTKLLNEYKDSIMKLNLQITNLQNSNKDYQTQVINLETQNNNLLLENSSFKEQLNQLKQTITCYENQIASLKTDEQIIVTFMYDESVYDIQIVNKNSVLTVATPTNTADKVFNGWKINGETIDLTSYTFVENTKVIAEISYFSKYDVVFIVDDTIYDSQVVELYQTATLPSNPTKEGYEFDGWSINGIDIISDISSNQVIKNITYLAIFTKLHKKSSLTQKKLN